jgi:ATP-grasp domain, R2K clade family 3
LLVGRGRGKAHPDRYNQDELAEYWPEALSHHWLCIVNVVSSERFLFMVMDICQTEDGLRRLETNCINAAGFYAADLAKLAMAIDDIA